MGVLGMLVFLSGFLIDEAFHALRFLFSKARLDKRWHGKGEGGKGEESNEGG